MPVVLVQARSAPVIQQAGRALTVSVALAEVAVPHTLLKTA